MLQCSLLKVKCDVMMGLQCIDFNKKDAFAPDLYVVRNIGSLFLIPLFV